ncbi:MAG: hypothetical protein QM749_08400 [Aquabacterium sp.]
MRQYKLLLSVFALAAAAVSSSARAEPAAPAAAAAPSTSSASSAGGKTLAKGSFVVPQHMADNWSMFAGVRVSARIKKLEPWALYESLNPCTFDEKFCVIVRDKLQVATVQMAKSPGYELTWVVTVPKEQYLKIGEIVELILPKAPTELADMVLDDVGKIVTPKCKWSQVVNGGDFEGVVCDRWNYSDLKFVAAKKKPAAEK